MRKYFLGCLAFAFMAVLMVSPPVHAGGQKTILVLDASGSMWGQIDGKAKITIAREVIAGMVKDWPKDQQIGLMAYGHRKKGDCGDIEAIIPAGKLDAAAFNAAVRRLNPKGKTPLTDAVKQAAQQLKYTEDKATVILISDGKETCNADPCAVATELEKAGVDFTAHVISFDVAEKDSIAQLQCMAKNTGGEYLTAKNASELKTALSKTVEKALEPAKKVVFEKPEKCAHLINGSFEKGPDPGQYTPYNSGSSSIPGWDIIKGQIDHIGSRLPSSDGGRHLDLDGSPGAGGVSQKIKTSPGVTYHLSFDVSANTECAPSIKRMRVSAAGKIKEFALQSSAWKKETITFTAKGKQTFLKFESLDETNHFCGPRLDNVKVSCEQESFSYQSDFQGGDTSHWSHSNLSSDNKKKKTLGLFNNEHVQLSLKDVPAGKYRVKFDFYTLHTWDGNGESGYGPDSFSFLINGQQYINATFSTVGHSAISQSYSKSTPLGGAKHPNQTDHSGANLLHYSSSKGAVVNFRYSPEFIVDHPGGDLTLSFNGGVSQPGATYLNFPDEVWALDNVSVKSIDNPNNISEQKPTHKKFNWVEYISKGNRFSVLLNKTADKFDDSNYTGWRTDPLGAAKGGETYSCIYSGGAFSCTGFYQTTGKVETVNLDRWFADPKKKKISIWGLILTFDEKGNVFSLDSSNHNNNYGLVGELQKSSGS